MPEAGSSAAWRSQNEMKANRSILAVLTLSILCACTNSKLPISKADVTHIRISQFPGDRILAEIDDTDTITEIFSRFSFGDQRHLTVKHPLPVLIDLYSGTNIVFQLSCEDEMMRIGNWEYTMSRDAMQMIQDAIIK